MAIVSVGSSFKILSIEYEWKRELKHTIDVDTRLSRSRYTKKLRVLSECSEKILHDSQQIPPVSVSRKSPTIHYAVCFVFL